MPIMRLSRRSLAETVTTGLAAAPLATATGVVVAVGIVTATEAVTVTLLVGTGQGAKGFEEAGCTLGVLCKRIMIQNGILGMKTSGYLRCVSLNYK